MDCKRPFVIVLPVIEPATGVAGAEIPIGTSTWFAPYPEPPLVIVIDVKRPAVYKGVIASPVPANATPPNETTVAGASLP